MPGVRGMLAKALIAALLGVLIGGAFALSASLREPDPPLSPIELRDPEGGRERNRTPPSRQPQPQREPGLPTVPAPDSPAPAPEPVKPVEVTGTEGNDDDGGDDEDGEGDDGTDDDDD